MAVEGIRVKCFTLVTFFDEKIVYNYSLLPLFSCDDVGTGA